MSTISIQNKHSFKLIKSKKLTSTVILHSCCQETPRVATTTRNRSMSSSYSASNLPTYLSRTHQANSKWLTTKYQPTQTQDAGKRYYQVRMKGKPKAEFVFKRTQSAYELAIHTLKSNLSKQKSLKSDNSIINQL